MPWHDTRIGNGQRRNISSGSPALVSKMGNVVQFIPRKADPDREARLIQEARAIYESIFPTEIARTAPSGHSDPSR
jgi:hypothetical protein